MNKKLSIVKQCELLNLSRASYYLKPRSESSHNLFLMRLIDKEFTRHPFYGIRRITVYLNSLGENVNHKRVYRLMRLMGLEAIYPKPKLSLANSKHKKYPYLLKDVLIEHPNQVWSTDITYIRTMNGFLYLNAIIDLYSRYAISWTLSNTLDIEFCLEALERALTNGSPEIFNTDQGSQFTSLVYTNRLEKENIQISMDGRGRVFDNIFIERFWRSVKYEEVYLKEYASGEAAYKGLFSYIKFYNEQRPHQSLDYKNPKEVYFGDTIRDISLKNNYKGTCPFVVDNEKKVKGYITIN